MKNIKSVIKSILCKVHQFLVKLKKKFTGIVVATVGLNAVGSLVRCDPQNLELQQQCFV